jgi:hypothetical protein
MVDTEPFTIVGPDTTSTGQPVHITPVFRLYQNIPNPFRHTSQIRYEIMKASDVEISIYNVLGAEVASLFSRFRTPGIYSSEFKASELSPGVYFCIMRAGRSVKTMKMQVMD